MSRSPTHNAIRNTQAAKGVLDTAAQTNAIARDVAAWRTWELGPWMARLARLLVCTYFLNLCYEDLQYYRRVITCGMACASSSKESVIKE